jgi:dienelactone hydrolase
MNRCEPKLDASVAPERTSMKQQDHSLSPAHVALLETIPLPAGAQIDAVDVDYELDGTGLQGYVAFDAASTESRPGVLIIHDWLGLQEYPKVRAQMLARLGYVAFAADIYGTGVRPSPQDGAKVSGAFYGDPALVRARATAGLAQLRANPLVDPGRIAVIGYCFGGFVALELARSGADVAGVVPFHGVLSTPATDGAANIRAKILVLAGGSDPVVPDEHIVEFKNEMRAAPQLDWQLVSYSGAQHAFTLPEANSPEHGAAYHPVAERRSWAAMRAFFDEIFA